MNLLCKRDYTFSGTLVITLNLGRQTYTLSFQSCAYRSLFCGLGNEVHFMHFYMHLTFCCLLPQGLSNGLLFIYIYQTLITLLFTNIALFDLLFTEYHCEYSHWICDISSCPLLHLYPQRSSTRYYYN